MVFVFDTNSLRVIGNYYPDRFPTFGERFAADARDGKIRSVREVVNELERQSVSKWLVTWAKKNLGRPSPGPEETAFVAEIFRVAHFRQLVGEKQRLTGLPVADPFVIAAAKIADGCVVTEEAHRRNGARIPNVCEHFGIEWTNVEGFLARRGWSF